MFGVGVNVRCFPKILPDHRPDDRADDRSGHEIREPMDGHGDTDADIESVKDRHPTQPPLFRKKREHRHGHGEGDGGMRRRPAPENSAAQEAKMEDMADVRADAVRRMGPAGKRFVGGSDQGAEKFGLSR